ncbi:MAG: hypothetical protein WAP47_08810 [Candidatus Rokuibacteriota bacterium]
MRQQNYTTAQPIWPGETGFIIAGGPSLAGFDWSRLAGRKVLAINSSILSYPGANVCFFGDARWWMWNAGKVKAAFTGPVFTCSEIADPRVFNLIKAKPAPYVSADPAAVTMQRTSLTAAMNLAVHFGCHRLVLMGADMKADQDGRAHHHPEHPIPQIPGCWEKQMTELRHVAVALRDLGVDVINSSMVSRIDWWPKQPIEELL